MSERPVHTPPPRGAFPEIAAADAADPRVVRAEQRLAMLRELAELGMALARDLTRRALETPDSPEAALGAEPDATPLLNPRPEPRRDPADAFARLSRAVRLTLALEATVEDRLSALRAGGMDRAAQSPAAADDDDDDSDGGPLPRDYPSAHRNRVRDAVFDVINHEITDIYPAHEILDTLYERLAEGERYDAFVERPLKDAVEAICADLGLHPDWSRWVDGAWAPPPPDSPRYAWQLLWAPIRKRGRARNLQ